MIKAPILFLAGPTASGKTALALRLAEANGAHVVNADSMQLYQDLPLLTARPTKAEMDRAPHHLFGHLKAHETWSAGEWMRAAAPHLQSALDGGPPVIVVGGTGLYFRTLSPGLAEIPDISDSVREETRAAFQNNGEAWARAILKDKDPASEVRIAPHDQQRLCRALEVLNQTGHSLSHWQARTRPLLPQDRFMAVVLSPPRDWLYARCDQRLDLMLKAGALDEVQQVLNRGVVENAPLFRVLGAPQLRDVCLGRLSLSAALDQAKILTRQYAKRQMTWFRNQTPDWLRVDSSQANSFPLDLLGLY